ncbi:uncharacterized protein LOC142653104 [Rhinoderma darwinii]|uniref:uncharacterized protein LOC142653104 n=1 Tax=Rhinoderma darwinii TaxID=43563 RepID=UPI003F6667E0
MDNKKPSLNFLYNNEKTYKYFTELRKIGNTHQDVFKYHNILMQFLYYLMNATSRDYKDEKTYDLAYNFINAIGPFEKSLSKGIAKENLAKRAADPVYMKIYMHGMARAALLREELICENLEKAATSKAAMEEEQQIKKDKERKSSPPVMRTKEEEYKIFTDKYPLTVEKEPPALKRCFTESTVHGQHLYDRWRKQQNRMRVDYIIGMLQEHRPDEEEVKRCIGHQLWKNNLPRVKDILDQWSRR